MIKTLKSKVLYILEKYPKTRDSDVRLTLTLWMLFYKSRIHKDEENGNSYIYLKDVMEMPREDNIKRIRAVIQNVKGKFLPTSLEVVKQRKINEQVWREYLKKNDI